MIAGATKSRRAGPGVPLARPIGLAHLSVLALSPPELVEVAATAGYDFVGVRVRAVTPAERPYPMSAGAPMLAETAARLRDTGVEVCDIEFLPLTATTTADDWLPVLESGAALGASVLTVAGADVDRARLHDTLTALTLDAADFGIRPALEPISYQPVSTVAEAAELAQGTGSTILLDPLHLQRGGSPLTDVAGLVPDLVPVLQLCDARLLALEGPGGNEGDSAAARGAGNRGAAEERVAALQREARQERLPLGSGELPLAELISACPPGVPVSLEIPNALLQQRTSPLEWARSNLEAARSLLTEDSFRAAVEATGERPRNRVER